MTHRSTILVALILGSVAPAMAQTTAVEVMQSVGVSSESISASATQVRVSGEPARWWRLNAEGSWGTRSRGGSDVFGTAYPYGGAVDLMEAWTEVTPQRFGLQSVRAGRYRTPFGMSSASDHAYIGFLRAPLIRYGGYWALSSGYLEHGLDVVAGVPRATVEVSVGRPADVGTTIRRDGVTTVGRAQLSFGTLVVGASRIDTQPYAPIRFARGRAQFNGVDARGMWHGLQLRGEWIDGQPFNGASTYGGYLDLIAHTPAMGRFTVLGRIERLDYETPVVSRVLRTKRATGGVRMRVWRGLALSANVAHQMGRLTQRRRTALEVGATIGLRKDYGQPQ